MARNLNQEASNDGDSDDADGLSVDTQVKMIDKLSPLQTFLALVKGYCAIVILLIPKAFMNGGYVFSPVVLLLSAILTGTCAIKLV